MSNLIRAVRMSFKYRWSIIASVSCSLTVALLWGANIGALYPFIEVVFEGESMHYWVDNRIENAEQAIAENQQQIAELRAELPTEDPSRQASLENRIARFESSIEGEQQKIVTTRWLEPYIKQLLPDNAFHTLLCLLVFFLTATFIRACFLMANMMLVARVGQRTVLDLQNMFFRNALQMEMSEMDVNGTGDLVGRIRGETNAIGLTITTLFGRTLREPMKMATCLIAAGIINWRLLLFSMLICPIAGWGMLKLARSTKRANKRAVEESAKLLSRLFQAVTYLRIVKAFNMERYEEKRFEGTANDVYRKSMKISWYNSLARMNNEMLGVCIMCLSFLASGYLVLNNQTHLLGIRLTSATMSFGELMLFFAFLVGVTDPLRKMADVYNLIQGGAVAAERVFPLIDKQPAIQSPREPRAFPKQAPTLRFENIRFSYQPGQEILKGVNLEIPSGRTLALLGSNGCGKSTLINLLPRFHDADAGRILLDDCEIRQLDLAELRRNVSYVTQTSMLFSDSVMENIRYGTPEATDEQVIAAAQQAHAHDFILKLAEGYQSDIGEHGRNLSGGQRQRITLARAILKDPKVVILDEATSQIDPQSEMLIHQALRRFAKQRTTLLITHRLSSLELADEIAIMQDGQIVDQGTHDELMQRCEIYRSLRATELKEAA